MEGLVSSDPVTTELQLCRINIVLAAAKTRKDSRKRKRKIIFILLKFSAEI